MFPTDLDSCHDEDDGETINWKFLEEEHAETRERGISRFLYGGTRSSTRNILQGQFNKKTSFLKALVAQSRVGREGLNLHKACRTIVLFHSDWNPGVMEQQIGRVDRICSYWEQLATEDRKEKINVRMVVFDGTYDLFQFNVLQARHKTLKAHLFRELLPPEVWSEVPGKLRSKLIAAAPDFSPP